MTTLGTKVLMGHIRGASHELVAGGLSIDVQESTTDTAIIAMIVRDGTLEEPESFFVVTTGNIMNTGQVIIPEEGEFIVVDWGHEPELVEGIEATIEFTNGTTIAHGYALDETGARMLPELTIVPGANGSRVTLSANTLWYEFVVQTQ